jgi:hypothetical protein
MGKIADGNFDSILAQQGTGNDCRKTSLDPVPGNERTIAGTAGDK